MCRLKFQTCQVNFCRTAKFIMGLCFFSLVACGTGDDTIQASSSSQKTIEDPLVGAWLLTEASFTNTRYVSHVRHFYVLNVVNDGSMLLESPCGQVQFSWMPSESDSYSIQFISDDSQCSEESLTRQLIAYLPKVSEFYQYEKSSLHIEGPDRDYIMSFEFLKDVSCENSPIPLVDGEDYSPSMEIELEKDAFPYRVFGELYRFNWEFSYVSPPACFKDEKAVVTAEMNYNTYQELRCLEEGVRAITLLNSEDRWETFW